MIGNSQLSANSFVWDHRARNLVPDGQRRGRGRGMTMTTAMSHQSSNRIRGVRGSIRLVNFVDPSMHASHATISTTVPAPFIFK